MQFLKQYPVRAGVYFLKEPDDTFERVYLKARQIEGRINDDDVVIHLPGMQQDASLKDEWKWRENSCKRFVRYFKQYPGSKVLDLGCGNGWFTNQLAKNVPGQYLGLDINSHELYQATRMFSTTHCRFAYGDIFSQALPHRFFDMIILNASIQYFQSLPRLIERCRLLLTVHGQIHILDSPFYNSSQAAEQARQRSESYYLNLGTPKMALYYHHHTWGGLSGYKIEVLYDPANFWSKIQKYMYRSANFFPWIKITR